MNQRQLKSLVRSTNKKRPLWGSSNCRQIAAVAIFHTDSRDKRRNPKVLDDWRERGATTRGPHQARVVGHVDNESGHCAINEPDEGPSL